jgi:hypothetical protein
MLGFEFHQLQVDHDKATKAYVVEKQVETVSLATDLQGVLPADKGKTFAMFQEELGDMLGELLFDV